MHQTGACAGERSSIITQEILIERMTWEEIKHAIATGKRRVVVMIGAMEQHGPHLPIGTDTMLGYAIGERLARALGDALVAPVIPVGYSIGHINFPGTISIPEDLLQALIREWCRCLAHHGFTEIILAPSHGGNYRALREVVPSLQEELKGRARIVAFTDIEPWIAFYRDFSIAQGKDPARVGVHAAQGETSMMLAADPELVHMERAVEGFLGDASARWRNKVPDPMETVSPTGILGDARGSTAEFGEAMLRVKIEKMRRECGERGSR
ncbi:MAG: creatininase family protein [Armatimonadetes bacterium]|nr:creatininase family protein [Armatimonadota bacterium]